MSEKEKENNKDKDDLKSISNLWSQAFSEVSMSNTKKLAPLGQYVIAGRTYTPRMLTPKLRRQADEVTDKLTKMFNDSDERDALVKQQAGLLLKEWDDSHYDDTDITYLEQVLTALYMANVKGFRYV